MNYCGHLNRILFLLTYFGLVCSGHLQAQIGTDHIRVSLDIVGGTRLGPFMHGILIEEYYDRTDFTGAGFFIAGPNKIGFAGSFTDLGVSVYLVEEGDEFTEENIRAGMFKALARDPFNPEENEGFVDVSEPVYLGFRTPATTLNPDFDGALRGIGWARVTFRALQALPGESLIQVVDHAMEYGGKGIVVGTTQLPDNQPNDSADDTKKIPLATFTESRELASFDQAWGLWKVADLDSDGKLDLIKTKSETGNEIFMQSEDGSFELSEGTIFDLGAGMTFGDVDGDGDLDVWLFQGPYSFGKRSTLWFNDGKGQFEQSAQILPEKVQATVMEDLNNDGHLDALVHVVNGAFAADVQTWLNDGSGMFSQYESLNIPCFEFHTPVGLGDANGDGFLDLFYGCGVDLRLAINQGNGRFVAQEEIYSGSGLFWANVGRCLELGDFDQDGDLDVVIPNSELKNELWLNDGEGNLIFSNAELGSKGQCVTSGDIDQDGDLDLLFTFQEGGVARLYINEGAGSFREGFEISRIASFDQPEMVDIDQDGDVDLLVKKNHSVMAYLNEIKFPQDNQQEDNVIEIPDEALRAKMLAVLGLPTNASITERNIREINDLNLDISNLGGSVLKQIGDFTGLEKATQLTSLNISGQVNFEMELLNHFPKLKKLEARQLQIQEFVLPAGLVSLEELDLSFNRIVSADLNLATENLSALNFSYNMLSEFSVPLHLNNLKKLQLDGNQLLMFQMEGDGWQMEYLSLDSNQLRSIELPQGLGNLTHLSLGSNRLTSLVLPAGLDNLTTLHLSDNWLASVQAEDEMPSLKNLFMWGARNRPDDFLFLNRMPGLDGLNVNGDTLDFSALPKPIASLTALTIRLARKRFFQLPPGYVHLEHFQIDFTLLDEVVLPNDLSSLSVLVLNGGKVGRLNLPDGMTSLESLQLWNNGLTELELPEDLRQLTGLGLGGNELKRLTIPISLGSASASGVTVNLTGNPLMKLDISEHWNGDLTFDQGLFREGQNRFDHEMGFDLEMDLYSPGTFMVQRTVDFKRWTNVQEIQSGEPPAHIHVQHEEARKYPMSFYRIVKKQR